MLIFCFDLVLALIQDFSALASQEESFICQASFKVTSTHFFKKRIKNGNKKNFTCAGKESLILDLKCCFFVLIRFSSLASQVEFSICIGLYLHQADFLFRLSCSNVARMDFFDQKNVGFWLLALKSGHFWWFFCLLADAVSSSWSAAKSSLFPTRRKTSSVSATWWKRAARFSTRPRPKCEWISTLTGWWKSRKTRPCQWGYGSWSKTFWTCEEIVGCQGASARAQKVQGQSSRLAIYSDFLAQKWAE